MAFFMLRRYLSDTAVRVDRILDAGTSPDERKQAMADVFTWGARKWRRLDQALVPVRPLLD